MEPDFHLEFPPEKIIASYLTRHRDNVASTAASYCKFRSQKGPVRFAKSDLSELKCSPYEYSSVV